MTRIKFTFCSLMLIAVTGTISPLCAAYLEWKGLTSRIRAIESLEDYNKENVEKRDALMEGYAKEEKRLITDYSGRSRLYELLQSHDKNRSKERKFWDDRIRIGTDLLKKNVTEMMAEREARAREAVDEYNDWAFHQTPTRGGITKRDIEEGIQNSLEKLESVKSSWDPVINKYRHYLDNDTNDPRSRTLSEKFDSYTEQNEDRERRKMIIEQVREEKEKREAQAELERQQKEAQEKYGHVLKDSEDRLAVEQNKVKAMESGEGRR